MFGLIQLRINSWYRTQFKIFCVSTQEVTKNNTQEEWDDIGVEFGLRKFLLQRCHVFSYTAFPNFCETNLFCNKTDTKSEVSV